MNELRKSGWDMEKFQLSVILGILRSWVGTIHNKTPTKPIVYECASFKRDSMLTLDLWAYPDTHPNPRILKSSLFMYF